MKLQLPTILNVKAALPINILGMLCTWVALGLVATVSGWVCVQVIKLSLEAQVGPTGASAPQPILVKVDGFNQVLERIEHARGIRPALPAVHDVFGSPRVPEVQQ